MALSDRPSFELSAPDASNFTSPSSSTRSSIASSLNTPITPVYAVPTMTTSPAFPWPDVMDTPTKDDVSYFSSARASILRTVSISSHKRDSFAPSFLTGGGRLRGRISVNTLTSWKRKHHNSAVESESPDASCSASVSSSSTVSARTSDDSAHRRSRSNSTGSYTSSSTHGADPTSSLPGTSPFYSRADHSVATQQHEKRTTELLTLLNHEPSFLPSTKSAPPTRVLDLGCGDGHWIYTAASRWPNTEFVGMDRLNAWASSERLRERNELPFMQNRVQWVKGNFLAGDLKQFAAGSFDVVRLGFLTLSVPKGHWRPLFADIDRILRPGGRIEFLDEVPVFPTDDTTLAADFGLIPHGDIGNKALEVAFKEALLHHRLIPTTDLDLRSEFFERGAHALRSCIGEPTMLAQLELQLPPVPLDQSVETTMLANWTGGANGEVDRHLSIKFSPLELQLHASRNLELLMSHRAAIWEYMSEHYGTQPDVFDFYFAEYARSQRSRLGLDTAYDPASDWEDEDIATPRRHSSQVQLLTAAHSAARTVRLLRVYEAQKPTSPG